MSKRQDVLKRYKQEIDSKYDPKNAVGNPDICEIMARAEVIERELEENDECEECDGWGHKECNECGHDNECGHCDGTGLIAKKNTELALA